MLRIPGRQEVARLTPLAVAPDKDKEALAGCNDVAALKAWIVHGPLIRSFGVFLTGWRRIRRLPAGIRDEFLRAAPGVLHAPLPLLAAKRGVGKVLQLLRETARR